MPISRKVCCQVSLCCTGQITRGAAARAACRDLECLGRCGGGGQLATHQPQSASEIGIVYVYWAPFPLPQYVPGLLQLKPALLGIPIHPLPVSQCPETWSFNGGG
jgi:hypothetical protein